MYKTDDFMCFYAIFAYLFYVNADSKPFLAYVSIQIKRFHSHNLVRYNETTLSAETNVIFFH